MSKNARLIAAGILGGGGATPWYLAGGAPTPIAVWWAKGAASVAASQVNLVNPGTYDLTSGLAPVLEASGWVGANRAWATGIVPALTYTIAVRVSGQNDAIRTMAGCTSSASQNFYIRNSGSGNVNWQCGNNNVYVACFAAAAVIVMAGKTTFYNGTQQTTIAAGGTDPTHEIYLMALNSGGSTSSTMTQGHMQGAAVWNSTLTPAQAIAVSVAMAAL